MVQWLMQTKSVTVTSLVGRDIGGRFRKICWSEERLGGELKDEEVAKGPSH